MAEQMLKHAGISQLKSKDLLDLRRINNQPIESESDSSRHMDSYLPFTPLGAKKHFSTSTPINTYNADDQFEIRNMPDTDSDDGEIDDESLNYSTASYQVHEHGYTKRLPSEKPADEDDEASSSDKKEKSDAMEAETETAADTDKPVPHDDTESTTADQDSQARVILEMDEDEGNSGETDTATAVVSADKVDNKTEVSDTIEKTDSKAEVVNGEEKTDADAESAETPIIPMEDEESNKPDVQPEKAVVDDDKHEPSEDNDVKSAKTTEVLKSDPHESHEMECQTETMSDDESSDGDDEKPVKTEADETPANDKTVSSELEDTTLTMLCESITKETFGSMCEEENDAGDNEEDEDDDDDDDYEEEIRKKSVKRRKNSAGSFIEWKEEYGSSRDLDGDPDLLRLPFINGWKRELVIRGVFEEYSKSGQPKRKPADVYYFTPEGSKLRSKVMIENHLRESGSDMTQANFSFIRRPIYKPPQEVVRQAGKSKGRAGSRKSISLTRSPSKAKEAALKLSPGKQGKKRKRGRPRSYALTNAVTAPVHKMQTCQEILVLPPTNLNPPEVVLEREGEEEPYDKTSSPSPPIHHPLPPQSPVPTPMLSTAPPKKYKPTARKSTTQAAKRNNQPTARSVSPEKKVLPPVTVDQLCGLNCPGRGGKPPDLQCGICMCLFHPECVNFLAMTRPAIFVCRRCVKVTGKGQNLSNTLKTNTVMNTQFSPNWSSVTLSTAVGPSPGMMVKNSNTKVTVVPGTSVGAVMPALRSCLSSTTPIPTGIVTNRAEAPGAIKTYYIPMTAPGVNPVNAIPIINSNNVNPVSNAISIINTSTAPVIGQVAPITVTSAAVTNLNKSTVSQTPPTSSSTPTSTPPASGIPGNLPKLTPAPTAKPPSGVTNSTGADPPQPPQLFKNGVSVFNVPKPAASSPSAAVSKDSVISVTNATLMTHASKDPNKNGGGTGDAPEAEGKSTPAQLLTLPSAVVSRLNLNQPLALKINNKQIVAPPSCFIRSKNGEVKVCLPANTVPVLGSSVCPLNMQVKVSGSGQENSLKFVGLVPGSPDISNKIDKTSAACRKPSSSKRNLKMCHFKNLWSGFEALQEIFSQLPVKDLLRAGCVCKTWNRIVKQMSLWQHLNMTGVCVKQWPLAVQFLDKVRTESLDFRGCDNQPLETDLFPLLGEISLKRLYLGEVTPSFLHQVGEHLSRLTHLSAEVVSPSGSCIDFAKLSHLKSLKELRLCHSSKGLDKDMEGNTDTCRVKAINLVELSALKQLEILVLTAVSGMEESGWSFLSETTQLRELELSDCSAWKSSVYKPLGQCKELEILKLAQGGTFPDTGMADALANLTKLKHLELKKWIIPHTIQDVLPVLDHLRTLIITPDTTTKAAVINRNTLSAVWDLSHIETLKWGIQSRDATIILNDGGGDDAASTEGLQKQTTQCIPFLADDVASDHIEQVDIDQMTQFISIEQLREKLHSLLPETNIEVHLLSNKISNSGSETVEADVIPNCAGDQISNGPVVKPEPIDEESDMDTDMADVQPEPTPQDTENQS